MSNLNFSTHAGQSDKENTRYTFKIYTAIKIMPTFIRYEQKKKLCKGSLNILVHGDFFVDTQYK